MVANRDENSFLIKADAKRAGALAVGITGEAVRIARNVGATRDDVPAAMIIAVSSMLSSWELSGEDIRKFVEEVVYETERAQCRDDA